MNHSSSSGQSHTNAMLLHTNYYNNNLMDTANHGDNGCYNSGAGFDSGGGGGGFDSSCGGFDSGGGGGGCDSGGCAF